MKKGFSLVELSIVLVILGLLTGGILAGQSLIRASELRAVSTEYQRYAAAVNTFRDKYFAVPGDMSSATSFWGAAHATPATCITTVGTGTQTCNGDSDGQIETNWIVAGPTEGLRAWQQLANAGLVEGSYTGVFVALGNVSGTNIPRSKIGAGWQLYYWNNVAGTNRSGNGIALGKDIAASANNNGIVKAEEAWNLDTKNDDGLANSGKWITWRSPDFGSGCISGALPNMVYDLTSTTNSCTMIMLF
jgi:prepilin-type N-terminal cleavage/methylation domain-containing protein